MNKNHTLTLILSLLLSTLTASAQFDIPRFQVGIKAGLNLNSSSLRIEDIADKKINAGYKVGLTGDFSFTDNFYLQTGVFFSTKGVVIKSPESTSVDEQDSWKQTVGLQYVQVPLLATYKLFFGSETKIVFSAGPYYSHGIGGKITTSNKYADSELADTKVKVNAFDDNNFEKVDYGLQFGLGLELEKFLFGIDSEFSFRNIAKQNNGLNPLYNKKSFKNKGVSFSVGYKF